MIRTYPPRQLWGVGCVSPPAIKPAFPSRELRKSSSAMRAVWGVHALRFGVGPAVPGLLYRLGVEAL
jgi:hypothetical protein